MKFAFKRQDIVTRITISGALRMFITRKPTWILDSLREQEPVKTENLLSLFYAFR